MEANTTVSPIEKGLLCKTGVIALPVHLPNDELRFFLVVLRPGYGRKPW
jgi:hypothetical protein